MSKSILLINASPRKNGTSATFSRTLKKLSEDKNAFAHEISTSDFLNNKYDTTQMKNLLSTTDIVCIVTPLYIDTMPYPLIYFLEEISSKFSELLINKSIFVIAQSGFPTPIVMDPIANSTELFAIEHNMKYLGAIRYAGGVMINGAELESLGKRGKSIIKYFSQMLDDIFLGNNISEDVKSNLGNNVPKFLYRALAAFMNHTTKKKAKEKNIDPMVKVYSKIQTDN